MWLSLTIPDNIIINENYWRLADDILMAKPMLFLFERKHMDRKYCLTLYQTTKSWTGPK